MVRVVSAQYAEHRPEPAAQVRHVRAGEELVNVVAGLIYYRCGAPTLERLVRSLERHGVQALVAVDGPFRGISTDVKTIRAEREALESFAGKRVLVGSRVWASEPAKRNAANIAAWEYIARRRPGWRLLGIDSDEELVSDITDPGPLRLGVAHLFGHRAAEFPEGLMHLRLHELTSSFTWGPSHFEASNRGIRYSMPHAMAGTTLPHLVIQHHGDVEKHPNYERYNRGDRIKVEANMGRPHLSSGPGDRGHFGIDGLPSSAETIYTSILPE